MDIKSLSQSDWVRAEDLNGRDTLVTIADWRVEEMKDKKQKLAIFFKEGIKPLLLNKVNTNSIAKFLGNETDDWIGHKIVLFPSTTEYQGDMVDCIRIKAPVAAMPTAGTAGAARARPAGPPPGHPAAFDDDIPL